MEHTDAIIWMVDSTPKFNYQITQNQLNNTRNPTAASSYGGTADTHHHTLQESRKALHELDKKLLELDCAKMPLCVVANKQDQPNVFNARHVAGKISFSLTSHFSFCQKIVFL